MAGCDERREQAELRATRRARDAAKLRWLRRLVDDLNQVLSAAASDVDADRSLLDQELNPQDVCRKCVTAEDFPAPVAALKLSNLEPAPPKFCLANNQPAPLGQTFVTKTRVTMPPPAHQGCMWSALTPQQQAAAGFLGYDDYKWDNGIAPTAIAHAQWLELTAAQQLAAQTLHYNEDSWTMELLEYVCDEPWLLPSFFSC